jgi:hypothetical protein
MKTILNPVLIEKQKLDPADIVKLDRLHEQRSRLFRAASKLNPNNNREIVTLMFLAWLLETLEFAMQGAWKFDRDRDLHSWWCLLPGCTCTPEYDNIFPIRAETTCKIHKGHVHES